MLRPVELGQIQLTDPFWDAWREAFVARGLEHQWEQCEQTGRIENFRRVLRGESGTFEGLFFNDSDVYKWMEAAAYALRKHPDGPHRTHLDEMIALLEKVQMEDGYINTFFQLNHPDKRFRNLSMLHEMYCMGHLIEAGIAHFEATGERRLLDLCIRVADHVERTFGPGKRQGYCGHQEIEIALLRLADVTSETRYRDLARWMIDTRGSRPSPFEAELHDEVALSLSTGVRTLASREGVYNGEYLQDDRPLREAETAVGHAVRATYFFTAAAMGFSEDAEMIGALDRIWQGLTQRRMYLTGGIGSFAGNEGFTQDYDLPNRKAYAETCAAVALAMWGCAMARATGAGHYLDVFEQAAYNGALAGVSLDACRYFYENPLESWGDHHRREWFTCPCCPPNVARFVLSLERYLASTDAEGGLWLHSAIGCQVQWGEGTVEVQSGYPWQGAVTVRYRGPEQPGTLRLRVPAWAEGAEWTRAGEAISPTQENGFAALPGPWQDGQVATLHLEIEPRWVVAHPKNLDCLGKAAVVRGPIVYCLEEVDLNAAPAAFSPFAVVGEVSSNDPREGVRVGLVGQVRRDPQTEAYATLEEGDEPEMEPVTLIPYHQWDNRSGGAMAVWLRTPTWAERVETQAPSS